MNTGRAIYSLLQTASAVTDVVGQKVYPEPAPPNTALPYITYELTDTEPEASKDPTAVDVVRMEVIAYAGTYSNCVQLGEAVRNTLDRSKYYAAGISIRGIYLEDTAVQVLDTPRRYAAVLRFTCHQLR
jgi:hypothetical protein